MPISRVGIPALAELRRTALQKSAHRFCCLTRLEVSTHGRCPSSSMAAEDAVLLLDGTRLPYETLGRRGDCPLIWGHGLGPEAPREMTRRSCESFVMIQEALAPKPTTTSAERAEQDLVPAFSPVLYDARGHGASSGWEMYSACIQQFHWRSLAFDMLSVATQHYHQAGRAHGGHGALIGGYSMGASTALWAAYLCPTAVRGLVLLCVTTAWEIRAERRGRLLANATKLEEASDPASAAVVRGAAFADLPLEEDLKAANLQMPVFLMASRDDGTHPAAVVERLAKVLPRGQAIVTDTKVELEQEFPRALRKWLRDHFGEE